MLQMFVSHPGRDKHMLPLATPMERLQATLHISKTIRRVCVHNLKIACSCVQMHAHQDVPVLQEHKANLGCSNEI